MHKNKFLPPLICGFGSACMILIPEIGKMVILLLPLAAAWSVFLYAKSDRSVVPINKKTAVGMGMATGLFAALFYALFETIMTVTFRSNQFTSIYPEMTSFISRFSSPVIVKDVMAVYKEMYDDITVKGFSFTYSLYVLFGFGFFFVILGIPGGLIGRLFINRRQEV